MIRARILSALVALVTLLGMPAGQLGGVSTSSGTDAVSLARAVHPCPNDAGRAGACEIRAILADAPSLKAERAVVAMLRVPNDEARGGLDHAPATGPPRA